MLPASQGFAEASPSPLLIAVLRPDARCLRIALSGRIDHAALPRLKPLVRRVADRPHVCLRIDLAQVEFLDSCGIGLLLALRTVVEEKGGSIGFVNHTPRVRRILDRSGIAALLMPAAACARPAPLSRAA